MDADLFAIWFPIISLIFYLNIKIWVDNKNNRSSTTEEIYSFPLDINFLGIGYIGGMMVIGEAFSLLGVTILLLFTIFSFITKSVSNLAIRKYYSNKKIGWTICIINYCLTLGIIYNIVSRKLF